MKKRKGTRYGYIARSDYPKLDELEDQVKAQIARLDVLIAEAKKLMKA